MEEINNILNFDESNNNDKDSNYIDFLERLNENYYSITNELKFKFDSLNKIKNEINQLEIDNPRVQREIELLEM